MNLHKFSIRSIFAATILAAFFSCSGASYNCEVPIDTYEHSVLLDAQPVAITLHTLTSSGNHELYIETYVSDTAAGEPIRNFAPLYIQAQGNGHCFETYLLTEVMTGSPYTRAFSIPDIPEWMQKPGVTGILKFIYKQQTYYLGGDVN